MRGAPSADGADALAMAGGDGSQALVAAIAAEHDLPYACIPAGTRNHFALDLGVDRDDVVGALDAFVDGGERRVDLAEVNGRVSSTTSRSGSTRRRCSARATARRSCARSSTRCPTPWGPTAGALDLRWTGPGGSEHDGRGDPGLEQPVPARRGRRLRHPARGSTTACSGIAVIGAPARPRGARDAAQGPWRSGPRRLRGALRRPGPGRRRRRGAHARRRRCASPSAPGSCGCGSPGSTPAPRRPRACRTPRWPQRPGWSASRRAVRAEAVGPRRSVRGVGPPDRRGHAAGGRRRLAAARRDARHGGDGVHRGGRARRAARPRRGRPLRRGLHGADPGGGHARLGPVLRRRPRVDLRKLRLDLELPVRGCRRSACR